VILCVFIICFTFTIPTPFEWTILERNDTENNSTYLQASFSDFGQNDLYKTVYYYLNVILFALIPFLLLAIFNAFLIRSVHISRKQRNTMIQGMNYIIFLHIYNYFVFLHIYNNQFQQYNNSFESFKIEKFLLSCFLYLNARKTFFSHYRAEHFSYHYI